MLDSHSAQGKRGSPPSTAANARLELKLSGALSYDKVTLDQCHYESAVVQSHALARHPTRTVPAAAQVHMTF
eukprot:6190021-Pleurochrysis_carterae.AAC.1